MNDRYEIPALKRAFTVLDLLSSTSENLGISEIARETDIPKTSLYRVLTTLEHLQCVVYDESTSTYRLGMKLWRLGRAYIDQSNLTEAAEAHMKHLASVCGESVFLGVLHEDRVTYIRQMESPKSVMAVQKLGKHAPAYCTATGRAIIAFLSDEEIDRTLEGHLEVFNANTNTDPAVLRRALHRVRKTGVAVVDGEYNRKLLCISSPVFDESCRPVASLTVAMLSIESDEQRVDEIARTVRDTASRMSRQLGYLGNSGEYSQDGRPGFQESTNDQT